MNTMGSKNRRIKPPRDKGGFVMEYLTTVEMSERWGISSRRIALLCEQQRIDGVIKKGKTWLIPDNVNKPEDKRRKQSKENL